MVVTDAEYQTMFIELTGSTTDIIPTSLSQSFMGYQALDLTHGSPVVNTLPFGPGVIDVQPMNPTNHNLSLNLWKKNSLKNNPFGVD